MQLMNTVGQQGGLTATQPRDQLNAAAAAAHPMRWWRCAGGVAVSNTRGVMIQINLFAW